jgi:putative FmdB family regulatory protein
MPLYEYECVDCGGFTAWKAMAESSVPTACVSCHALSGRVLSAVAVGRGRARPRGGPEPRLVKRNLDPPPAAPQPGHTHGHERPWMVGH